MLLLSCVLNKQVLVSVVCVTDSVSAFTLILKLLGNTRFHAIRINQCFLCTVTVWFCDVTLSTLLNVKEENYFKIL